MILGRLVSLAVLLAVVAAPSAWAAHAAPGAGQAFLTSVQSAVAQGRISPAESLYYRFLYAFAPDDLPTTLQAPRMEPLKCGTDMIIEYQSLRHSMPDDMVSTIDGFLRPPLPPIYYDSPGGRFRLFFFLGGDNGVPDLDIAPADGIPDFIATTAAQLDQAWDVQIDQYGYDAPPLGAERMQVTFQDMQFYGYTAVVDPDAGLTRLVLNNDFAGFPPNDDPDGDVIGAIKVTAAHELRHASQYVTSRWSEAGWVELDATWVEELVQPQVNDYRNYLSGESPVRRPDIPLDSEPGATGSYEDCVFQLWLQQVWGAEIIREFWARRATDSGETYLDSWQVVLAEHGSSLAAGWAQFTVWNHATGTRSVPDLGYVDGPTYPEGALVGIASQYPYQISGQVQHLAANAVRLEGLGEMSGYRLRLDFDGQDAGGTMSLGLQVVRRDGTGQIVEVPLDDGNAAEVVLPATAELLAVGVVVGNPMRWGPARTWELHAELEPLPPVPQIQLETTPITLTMVKNTTAALSRSLANIGETGSFLDYRVQLWNTDPAAGAENKTVVGSMVGLLPTSYLPGETLALLVTVTNNTTDNEYLNAVSLDFPVGVVVLESTDFIGGGLGDLVSDAATGDGALVSWFGETSAGGFGVVRQGETAVGEVTIAVATGFTGDLTIDTSIGGDTFGLPPHEVTGQLALVRGDPMLQIVSPNGGEAVAATDSLVVSWNAAGCGDTVSLWLSRDGGEVWEDLGAAPTAPEQTTFVPGGATSHQCRLRLIAGEAGDESDALFTLFNSPAWLQCSAQTGALARDQVQNLELSFDATGLSAGNHRAWLVVAHDGVGSPLVVPVTVRVVSGPRAPLVLAQTVIPNPFNPATYIGFELARASSLTLDILDARGGLVRRLWSGSTARGPHRFFWDGGDQRGRPAPAGVYLARIRSDGHESTVKMTLVR